MTDDRAEAFAGIAASGERLDRALLRLRRVLIVPPTTTLPIPSIGRPVDLAKVVACQAIYEGQKSGPDGSLPTVKDVATALDVDHSTASRLLTDAEAEGLIVRQSDPVDRRRTVVALTDMGRSVVADSSAIRVRVIEQIFAEWKTTDVELLSGLLERMIDTFTTRAPEVIRQAQIDCQVAVSD
ncbi:MAG: MarR family winged helix-turn-helix transcriptional regulator [Actinomycetes bacterium]